MRCTAPAVLYVGTSRQQRSSKQGHKTRSRITGLLVLGLECAELAIALKGSQLKVDENIGAVHFEVSPSRGKLRLSISFITISLLASITTRTLSICSPFRF